MSRLFSPRNVAIGGVGAGLVLYYWPKGKGYAAQRTWRWRRLTLYIASRPTALRTSLTDSLLAELRTHTLQQLRRREVSETQSRMPNEISSCQNETLPDELTCFEAGKSDQITSPQTKPTGIDSKHFIENVADQKAQPASGPEKVLNKAAYGHEQGK